MEKASVIKTGFHPIIKGRFGLEIKPDILFPEANPKDSHALVIPGGFFSYGFDEAFDKRILNIAGESYNNGGYIATMCVGILPIAEAGLLKGRKATTYPYSHNHDNIGLLKKNGAVVINEPVIMDNRIISCSGPGSSLEVAFLLIEQLMGRKTSQEVRKFMIYSKQ